MRKNAKSLIEEHVTQHFARDAYPEVLHLNIDGASVAINRGYTVTRLALNALADEGKCKLLLTANCGHTYKFVRS